MHIPMKLIIPALCLFLMISCQNHSGNAIRNTSDIRPVRNAEEISFPTLIPGDVRLKPGDFGEVIDLQGTPVETDAIFQPRELDMIVRDDLLIMRTSGPNGLIKFLSIPDLRLIREVGTMGQGPGELLFPKLVASEDPNILCYVYDLQQENIYRIDQGFELSETGFALEKKEGQLFGNKQFVEINAHSFFYVSNSQTGKGIYSYLPDHPDSLKLVHDLEDGFKQNLGWSALIGDFTGNPDRNRLAFAYKYFHQIRFFDLQTGNTRTLSFDDAVNNDAGSPDARSILAPTSITHFWGVSAQPGFLYCLYSGRTPLEVNREFKEGTDHIFIEQYDWNGNPVKKYRLDHWGYFCVDEARRTIYLAAVNADEALYMYRF